MWTHSVDCEKYYDSTFYRIWAHKRGDRYLGVGQETPLRRMGEEGAFEQNLKA